MLRPSYTDLTDAINNGVENSEKVASRYTIVIAAAKRARQLVDHAEPLSDTSKIDKPVSIAIHELYEGKIKIRQNKDEIKDDARPVSTSEVDFSASIDE